jgi:hypothetical protein
MSNSWGTHELADYAETVEILKGLQGGPEFLDWFGGKPIFGDSEVISLCLDRLGPSYLRIEMYKLGADNNLHTIIVTMTLKDQIDLSLEGFSHQNVVGGLAIRRVSADHQVHQSLIGVGITTPDHEINLGPCAGVFGTIRATISSISFEVGSDPLQAIN